MRIFYYFQILLVVFIAFSCGPKQDKNDVQGKEELQPQNTIILLDLSNRLALEEQVKRDSNLIAASLQAFENNQIKYRFQISNDKLRLAIAYQNSSAASNFGVSEAMVIDMTERRMNKPAFNKKKQAFFAAVDSIYAQATNSGTSGADIWGFFCNDLTNNLEKGAKNKIIILTDGYLQFDPNIQKVRPKGTYMANLASLRNKQDWETIFDSNNLKLNPCPDKFDYDIEVLMLEINPKQKHLYTNEIQIIEKFWTTWFEDMGIKCKGIHQSSYYQPNDLNAKIAEFLKD